MLLDLQELFKKRVVLITENLLELVSDSKNIKDQELLLNYQLKLQMNQENHLSNM